MEYFPKLYLSLQSSKTHADTDKLYNVLGKIQKKIY